MAGRLAPGGRLGGYVIEARLGPTRFAARARSNNQAVLIQLPELHADGVTRRRFERAAQAAARVNHDHLERLIEIARWDGTPYRVTRLVDGRPLSAVLAQPAALTQTGVVDLFLPVLAAVAAIHDRGLVHGDICPERLIIGVLGGTPRATLTGLGLDPVGLPRERRVAPELRRRPGRATPLSDQFSLGLALLETLDRCTPGQLDGALGDVIARGVAKVSGQRFGSVRAFGRALMPWASPAVRQGTGPELAHDARSEMPVPALPTPPSHDRRWRLFGARSVAWQGLL